MGCVTGCGPRKGDSIPIVVVLGRTNALVKTQAPENLNPLAGLRAGRRRALHLRGVLFLIVPIGGTPPDLRLPEERYANVGMDLELVGTQFLHAANDRSCR